MNDGSVLNEGAEKPAESKPVSGFSKLIATIGTAGALIAGSIWVGKPAEELPQFDGAQVIISEDTRTIAAHEQVVMAEVADQIVPVDTIAVPEVVVRDQVSMHLDSAFRIGDAMKITVCRNDSVLYETQTAIKAETYPAHGVLKYIVYAQPVVSQGE